MKFIELPFSIILEICGHLNARALVSLADVRRATSDTFAGNFSN